MRKGLRRFKRLVVASTVVGAVALIAASAGLATRGSDYVTCDNGRSYPITVTSQPTDNSVGWGVGTISGGSHLIPVAFSGSFYDVTTQTTLFSFTQAKGDGNGQHNQAQLTCSIPSEQATAGEMGGIPGVSDSDVIESTFYVTAVLEP